MPGSPLLSVRPTLPAPADRASLPPGFGVRLAPGVIRTGGGRTLYGGSPARPFHLRPADQQLLAGGAFTVEDSGAALLARALLDRGLAVPVLAPLGPFGVGRLKGVPAVGDVTVVVPVKDRPEALARLLRALGPALPVIVVDDGSADPRAAEVARAAGADVVRHATSRGSAAARNTGLSRVRTPFVAFVDSDVEPRQGWLEVLLPHFADPAVGLVAPRVVGDARVSSPSAPDGWRGRLHRWLEVCEESRSSLDLGPEPALVAPRGQVPYVPPAALIARTAALGPGFAEEMHIGEDADLLFRLVEAGWRIRYEPAAEVVRDHQVEVGDWLRRKAFHGTSATPLAKRHPGAVPPLAVAPWQAAALALLLLQRKWSVAAALAVTGAATVRLAGEMEQRTDHPLKAAASLASRGLASAGRQLASALGRHWWPVTLAGGLVSRRVRRAALAAALIEAVADRRRVSTGLDPVPHGVAHRLDDLAYGAGLWLGAWRGRTAAPLLPDLSGRASTVDGPVASREA